MEYRREWTGLIGLRLSQQEEGNLSRADMLYKRRNSASGECGRTYRDRQKGAFGNFSILCGIGIERSWPKAFLCTDEALNRNRAVIWWNKAIVATRRILQSLCRSARALLFTSLCDGSVRRTRLATARLSRHSSRPAWLLNIIVPFHLFPKNLSTKSFLGTLFAQRVRRLFTRAYQRTLLGELSVTRSARKRHTMSEDRLQFCIFGDFSYGLRTFGKERLIRPRGMRIIELP